MLKWLQRRVRPAADADPGMAIGPAPEMLDEISHCLTARDWQTARRLLEEALTTAPDEPRLRLLSARCHRLALQPVQALEDCERALGTSEDPSAIQHEMALNYLLQPDLPAALDSLHVAVALRDDNGPAWLSLGETLNRLERNDEATEALQRAIDLLQDGEDRAQAWFLFGQLLMVGNRFDEARHAFEECLRLAPDMAEVHIGLGNVALWQDREPQAVVHYQEAMRRIAKPSRSLQLNLGSALQHCGRFEEARAIFRRVLAEQPHDHASRWYVCQMDLTLCNWAEGWANYGSRFGSGAISYRPMPFTPWDGRPLPEDTLLVLADEGIGDEILYASCILEAAQRVKHLIVECEPRLEKMFRRSFPTVHVVGTRRENTSAWLDGLPTPSWQAASGDLPRFFRREEHSFPRHTGYLTADPQRVAYWRERLQRELGPGLKVGISWRGGLPKTRAKARSIDSTQWGPIVNVPGVHFVNLQYGAYEAELAALNTEHGAHVVDFPEAIRDYDETAALVVALDLVVTVCTAIVHLAGALGKPVWVLTPLSPGWRYTAHRDSMPWYPSSRIFRQTVWGEWDGPCRKLASELKDLTNSVTIRG